ncbi:uncharacterized protein BX663DRAFT_489658 [Cokeromyces recurvatus]|uniref:uncharacterized protein n=1 Tax=Cokeromyces recurvatus TaxID=90255 RepID=UPI00221F1933|nr:uncharacterized protein BX663DRAFT_489658 [Cokeromyces recurvatus]KAI7898885.1 hypothetical protein BX663DRAFT_489658 [Cokeromyces recurvatus]
MEDPSIDCFAQQFFLSPTTHSPLLQDFDDMDSLLSTSHTNTSHFMKVMSEQQQQQQQQQQLFFPLQQQQQPINIQQGQSTTRHSDDYPSSFDLFQSESFTSSSSHFMDLYAQQQDMVVSPTTTNTTITSPQLIYHGGRRASSSFSPHSHQLDQHQPFSAPAHMGYELMVSHMGNYQQQQQQQQQQENTTAFDTSTTGAHSLEEYESMQINQQLLAEKKRRRRESHNAGTMLPESMLEELVSSNSSVTNNKPNKGAILRKSVDHIRILQQEVLTHKHRVLELEKQLTKLTKQSIIN